MFLCLVVAIVISLVTVIAWGDFYASKSKSDLRWSLFSSYILFLLTLILFAYLLGEI
jgi:hypothetical protein